LQISQKCERNYTRNWITTLPDRVDHVESHLNTAGEKATLPDRVDHVESHLNTAGEKATLPDRVDHIESHLNAALGVVRPRLAQAAHAVVAVAQDLDPHAVVLLRGRDRSTCKTTFPSRSPTG